MSRCGCDSGCQCIIDAGENVVIEGDGSLDHHYIISVPDGGVGPPGPPGESAPYMGVAPFSMPGALTLDTSGRWYAPVGFNSYAVLASLKTPGSSDTEAVVMLNGVDEYTITIAAGAQNQMDAVVIGVAALNWLQVRTTVLGTGATDLVVQVF